MNDVSPDLRHTIDHARKIYEGTRGELGRDRAEDSRTIISFARAIVELSRGTDEGTDEGDDDDVEDTLKLPGKHCDDYIHDFTAPHCLRFFLLVHRMPAMDAMLCREFGVRPKLFATYRGERVRVVMASRMGDVGITKRIDSEDGYQARVMVADLSDFGGEP